MEQAGQAQRLSSGMGVNGPSCQAALPPWSASGSPEQGKFSGGSVPVASNTTQLNNWGCDGSFVEQPVISPRSCMAAAKQARQPAVASKYKTAAEALVALSDMFEAIINDVLADPMYLPFKNKVVKREAPDYNTWVRPEDEQWLTRIKKRCRDFKYTSRDAFWEDVVQVHINCENYNAPGCGLYGGAWLVERSDALINAVCSGLDAHAKDIEEAEGVIARGDTQPARPAKRVRFE